MLKRSSVLLAIVVLLAGAALAVPQTLNIQGRIAPPPDSIEGKLSFDLTSSTKSYADLMPAAASQYNSSTGVFNCIIDLTGKTDAFSGTDAALTVKVDKTVVGKQAFQAIPYALRAEAADRAALADRVRSVSADGIEVVSLGLASTKNFINAARVGIGTTEPTARGCRPGQDHRRRAWSR
jgi:hypothetical protein